MESNVCDSDNLPGDAENANLNEATPAVTPVLVSDLPKDTSILLDAVECDDAIRSTTPDKFAEDLESTANNLMNLGGTALGSETDADFFTSDLSISDVPAEKITENVEDIVQDLENLLGESNDSYRFGRESFDNSKLVDSYAEVNSSNVTELVQDSDLYQVDQTNLETSSLDCDILPDISVAPSGNIEDEFEGKICRPPQLQVAEAVERIGIANEVDSELKEIINEPVIVDAIETADETGAVIDTNILLQSHVEPDKIIDDISLKCQTEVVEKILNENAFEGNIETLELDAVKKNNVPTSETETNLEIIEAAIETCNVKVCSGVTGIAMVSETIAVDENLKPEEVSSNLNENLVVFEQPDESATELLEELIKDSGSATIDSECLESFLDDSNNEAVSKAFEEEQEQQCVEAGTVKNLSEIIEDLKVEPDVTGENSPTTTVEHSVPEIEVDKGIEISPQNLVEGGGEVGISGNVLENYNRSEEISKSCQITKEVRISDVPLVFTFDIGQEDNETGKEIKDVGELIEPAEVVKKAGEEMEREDEEIKEADEKIKDTDEEIKEADEEKKGVEHEENEKGTEHEEEMKAVDDERNGVDKEKKQTDETMEQSAETIEQVVDTMEQAAETTEQAAETMKQAAETMEQADKTMEQADETIKQADAEIKQINEEINEFDEDVRNTDEEMKEIGEEIQELAEEEIEEINKTYEEIKETGEEIKEAVEEIKTEDVEQADADNKIAAEMEDISSQDPKATQKVVEEIDEEGKRSDHGIQPEDIKSVDKVKESGEEVKQTYPEVEEIHQEVEELSSSVEERSSSVEEFSSSVKEQNLSIKSSTELVQPLTVDVEDHDFSEQHIPVEPLEEQAEKCVTSTGKNEFEIFQATESSSESEQMVDTDDNHETRAPLKMTITKSDNIHSILKIYDPNEADSSQIQQIPKLVIKSTPSSTTSDYSEPLDEQVIPKITIKPILTPTESQHSPKLTIKPIKPPVHQDVSDKPSSPKTGKPSTTGTASPRITIKPVIKPESLSPLKLTIRPYPKVEEMQSSPKLNIKPIVKPAEETLPVEMHHSPKITIKPIVKPPEESQSYSEERHSPRITIKPIIKPPEDLIKEQAHPEERHGTRVTIKPVMRPSEEEICVEERHSPRITIKPVVKSAEESTKEEEETHSPRITIKPIVKPQEEVFKEENKEEKHSPKITIKPIVKPLEESAKEENASFSEERPSSRVTIKPVTKPSEDSNREVSCSEERPNPRITIKPVLKPAEESAEEDEEEEEVQFVSEERPAPRITIKPVIKPHEEEVHSYSEERHSPRITIKPVIKPPEESIREEVQSYSEGRHSPRVTIKPIVKPESETENVHSPRITIKPIVKPPEDSEHTENISNAPIQPFKLNIKPVVKPAESSPNPKVTYKPLSKIEPDSEPIELIDFEDQIKQERIVLKIAKNTKKDREAEKLKKIKVKLSKERGHARIVSAAREGLKRSSGNEPEQELKHFKPDLPSDITISLISSTSNTLSTPDVTITRIGSSGVKETTGLRETRQSKHQESSYGDIEMTSVPNEKRASSSTRMEDMMDPLADIPVFEITLESAAAMSSTPSKPTTNVPTSAAAGTPPVPRKRGRPRKVPLEVREEFKDPKEEEVPPPVVVEESTRPKRSCRGASVKATLGIKPRKPRAPSTRTKATKRTVATRASTAKKSKERKPPAAKLKLSPEPMVKEQLEFKEFETKDAEFKQVPVPAESANREVVIYEEETRMSAENSSRAQTPAKQVLTSSAEVVIEESQSSVQSNTTTESGEKTQKVRKGPRLEVHQEPEGEVISADKLAEYSWGGGGPYMLQEQVAQFLGIKSFKRKYPGIQRRTVDMQERDFIRESCLASEAMCDMGLTAVRSEDILDIMYTDFQHKYEEYCKHQRDRQAKDVSNKQKALSLAASQEKNKLDIVEQAVQSAFQWNASFNKARRDQRRACMDLQTFTVHFPKGKMKQVNKPSIGHYPLALVPGQYTDYYKKYTPIELSNLPLNTIGCKTIGISSVNQDTEESQSDGSGSDSDSSSSDSDSSDSSSGAEDCKMCSPAAHAGKKMLVH